MDIKHKEAKLLRDALIKVSKMGCKNVKEYSTMAIKTYQTQVSSYCECLERARNLKEGYEVCLDCSKSYPIEEETLSEFDKCKLCDGFGETRAAGFPMLCAKCGGSGMVKK